MASGSGKDPDDNIREPVHGHCQREDFNAAASTGAPSAAAVGGGADASPAERPKEWVREQDGDGSCGTEGSSSAAAAVDRKGKKVAAVPSPTRLPPSSAGSSPSTSFAADAAAAASGAETSSSAAEEKQQEEVKSPQAKRTFWSKAISYSKKICDRKGRQMINQNSTGSLSPELPKIPHVDHQTIPITGAINHYSGHLHAAMQRLREIPVNVMNLLHPYSKFRPVIGDGECFYRSFIFSYLEQVLDRQDTHEEHRLLAVVKGVTMQHAHLGWTSEYSRSHKAFKKLIKKVMRWKRQGRWSSVASTNSYRMRKLLEFFSTYDTTEDIFVFLRLVSAIWICSHREEYEQLITGLREDYSLKDWCFQHVTPPRELADHVQMTALANALEVPLKVEQLSVGPAQVIYTGPGVPGVSVTLLFTGNHYDIIYPRPPGDASSSQQTSHAES